jgi:hypothetical protein
MPVAWVEVFPTDQASAELGQGTTVTVRKWFGVIDYSDFDVVASADTKIYAGPIVGTWIPDPRFNIYILPSGIIGVIATTGASVFIDMAKGASSPIVDAQTIDPQRSSDWRFVGTILETSERRLQFFPASAVGECIPLMTGRNSPFRKKQQAEGRCPKVANELSLRLIPR